MHHKKNINKNKNIYKDFNQKISLILKKLVSDNLNEIKFIN